MNLEPGRERRRRERGIALVTSVILVLPVAALVAAAILHSSTAVERFRDSGFSQRATSVLVSALEAAKVVVSNASYSDPTYPGRNAVLAEAADQVDAASLWTRVQAEGLEARVLDTSTNRRLWVATDLVPLLPADQVAFRHLLDVDLGTDATSAYVARVTESWYVIECSVVEGNISRTGTVMVRDRDPFSRYNVFCDKSDQPVSVRITGDIHSNSGLRMMYGGWDLPGFVSATKTFSWTYGASWSNVQFVGGYSQSATAIEMPDLAAVQARALPPVADATAIEIADDYVYIGAAYYDVRVQFAGSDMTVQARNSSGTLVSVYSGPIAGIQRVYAKKEISSLAGDLDGRISVFSESSTGITIQGNLRYVDSDGDLALTDPDEANPSERNPDYDGSSSLGILAPNGYVTYGFSTPDVLEVHGAILTGIALAPPTIRFDASGKVYNDFSSPFLRDRVVTLGSCVTKYGKYRGTVDAYGNQTSGFEKGIYLYDRSLLDHPPPYFLDIERPHFKGFWIHESFLDL